MREKNIDAAVIEDSEGRRDANLRYLCGMPSDALLFLFADGDSLLLPWDMILAEKIASADRIEAYGDYQRNPVKAVEEVCRKRLVSGASIELAEITPYPMYNEISKAVDWLETVCRIDGISAELRKMRSIKDQDEIKLYRTACELTDKLIDALEAGFNDGGIQTELDAAMLIEAESRRLGAEGPGFETLAAGSRRSWGIHAFPSFTDGPIGDTLPGGGGLSIIDCGLLYRGYATDVTIGIRRGKLSSKQKNMASLVEHAHSIGVEACTPGTSAAAVAAAVDNFFSDNGWEMPHSLGHGIGLDVHEAPILKNNEIYDKPMLPGMIFTIEPGLYDAAAGGIRLENDYLMTENGARPLTSSRILTLP